MSMKQKPQVIDNLLQKNQSAVKQKRKYFAYLHEDSHWVIKPYIKQSQFQHYLDDCLDSKGCVKGIIAPFEIDGSSSSWQALEHIKSLIEKIDWNKY